MGLNFYHRHNECGCCGRYDEDHIGKSSMGWTFLFHATETERSYQDWLKRFHAGGTIVDEYGKPWTLDKFIEKVQDKQLGTHSAGPETEQWGYYTDPEGYAFSPGEFS